jgi:hypothetical protein
MSASSPFHKILSLCVDDLSRVHHRAHGSVIALSSPPVLSQLLSNPIPPDAGDEGDDVGLATWHAQGNLAKLGNQSIALVSSFLLSSFESMFHLCFSLSIYLSDRGSARGGVPSALCCVRAAARLGHIELLCDRRPLR